MGDIIITNHKGIIYHYCSTETFFSIISNKCLRLSDITKTNDYLEKEWSLKLQKEIFEESLIAIFHDRKIDFDPYKEDSILGYGNYFDIFKVAQNELLSSPVFASCFSKDGDLLSQWRAYASDGSGISIGLSSEILNRITNLCPDFYFMDILYDKDKQVSKIHEVIGKFFDELFTRYSADKSSRLFASYLYENDDWICPQLAYSLLPINCSLKNTAFIEECERRLIFLPRYLPNYLPMDRDIRNYGEYYFSTTEIGNFQLSPIKYRPNPDQIIAYCDLNFSELIKEGIIREVIIGPKSKSTETDIIRLMDSLGYDISSLEVKASNASYK